VVHSNGKKLKRSRDHEARDRGAMLTTQRRAKSQTKHDGLRHNVDVTGDRGTVRPKGADARGRPC
jgi:hypothetical protein